MDPPSPSKLAMSPGMPIFPVSPERVAGTKPPYDGPVPSSPSLPSLRNTSPVRLAHRRQDSDVSVHGLAAMFENLEVKDFKEAQSTYMKALQKEKTKHASTIRTMEKNHQTSLQRYELRQDELKDKLRRAEQALQASENSVPREMWDKQRQEHRQEIVRWDDALKQQSEARKQFEAKNAKLQSDNETLARKARSYKDECKKLNNQLLAVSGRVPAVQAEKQAVERDLVRARSDLKHQTSLAEKYRNEVYQLQVDLESTEATLREELHKMKETAKLMEEERDALKTTLKEEEVLRIAAEGRIPLPAVTTEEHDEFGSPVRSPRKQRSVDRDDDDKENVAPKKASVELRFLQQELASEKRLHERAREQIDFMKMECQFRCCSCRIADSKGAQYVYDSSYASEMEHIKAAVPALTPPASIHEDEPMEKVTIKQEPVDDSERPITPPTEPVNAVEDSMEVTSVDRPVTPTEEPVVAFSPTTGTFRTVPSPSKADGQPANVAMPAVAPLGLSSITETTPEPSSPWAPDACSTMIRAETASPPPSQPLKSQPATKAKVDDIVIHEDVIMDSDDEDAEPQTPLHEPSGPATPGQYLTRTITTTTTIPLHFSPVTPAHKKGDQPMTPTTIPHMPMNASSQPLGDLSLNKLPIDREAALEQIRLRRGRARSMAAGQGTPRKQMLEGVKERRDISAPVSRVRR